jgi:hypothetical protein
MHKCTGRPENIPVAQVLKICLSRIAIISLVKGGDAVESRPQEAAKCNLKSDEPWNM